MKYSPYVTFVLIVLALTGCEPDPPLRQSEDEGQVEDTNRSEPPPTTPLSIDKPQGFPAMDIPEDNPTTEEGVALGRQLYYDPILHKDSAMACASCHLQEQAFSSPDAVLPHQNLGWKTKFLWDGEVEGQLEDAMLFEVEEFMETKMKRLNRHEKYQELFWEAMGVREIESEDVARALAQFQRTLVSSDSKYDKVQRGGAFFTEKELDGYNLFFSEEGDCFHCHGGPLFTDQEYHNNALDSVHTGEEAGRYNVTGDPLDKGKFLTPSLRNIELTAPYMHDGRYQTLREVVDFYSEGLVWSETVDPLMKNVHQGGVQLTEDEKESLVAFLKTLTDERFVSDTSYANPFQ